MLRGTMQDFHVLRDEGRSHLARGDHEQAVNALVEAAAHVLIAESEYAQVLRLLVDALQKRGDMRGALSVLWYLSKGDAQSANLAAQTTTQVPAEDRARTKALLGDMRGAAAEMESVGKLASAAVFHEKAGDFVSARALWSRLGQSAAGTRPDDYVSALIHFNTARCSKHAGQDAAIALRAAVRLLEEAADHFESAGLRERAFDCFQVLVQIGKEGEIFEDVLEGYVNCVRILREDHLKYFALQYFDEAIRAAKERTEFSAAATLARDASDYARSIGLQSASTHYLLVHGELFREVARIQTERGAPAEISENALLASIVTFAELAQFKRVGDLYRELGTMELDEAKRSHYAQAAQRYANLPDERVDATGLAAHLRQDNAFPEVWHLDVLEWEHAGSASEACADILLDPRWPDLLRRKALLARLTAFSAEREGAATGWRKRLAVELADLQLYAVLSPLEALYAAGPTEVQVAVVASMQRLSFKRTFTTVRDALFQSQPQVLAAATKTVEALYFQHAFDPLARIVRESSNPDVRGSSLLALARIDSQEAAEFLLGVLDHGAPQDKTVVHDALVRARGVSKFLTLAKQELANAPPVLQKALHSILRQRGAA
jgi:hypothetical protein